MKQPQNVIFWGAGATASLGIRTTGAQTKFIQGITAANAQDKPEPLKERIARALDPNGAEPWSSALFDLITILGDRDKNYESIDAINNDERDAMRRNWPGANDEELEGRIISLRLIYDCAGIEIGGAHLSGQFEKDIQAQ